MEEQPIRYLSDLDDMEGDVLGQSAVDKAFVEHLLYDDELSFEEAAFLTGYYDDVEDSFS